jgi:hypothetical protein
LRLARLFAIVTGMKREPVRWTDLDLAPADSTANGPGTFKAVLAELKTQPGRWAEVARYTSDRRKSAYSRGSQTQRRNPEIEYAVRDEGNDTVLYMRVREDA